jgi:hypothetical protein
MQGKLDNAWILCFQLNFPVSRGNLEDKSVCMGNERNTWLNVPIETKETEATMCLHEKSNDINVMLYFLCWKAPWHLIKPLARHCSCERSIQCQSFIEIFRGLISKFLKTRHHRTVTYSHIKIRKRHVACYPVSERKNKLILHNLTDCSHAMERVFCKENTTSVNLS